MHAADSGEEGFALPQAIFAVGALSLLAVMLVQESSSRSADVSMLSARLKSEAATEGAIRIATAHVDNPGSRERFSELACSLGDQRLLMTIRPETALVDINISAPRFLTSLLEVAGIETDRAEELASRLVDYRDADDTRVEGGAERADYVRRFGLDYGPRNGPFESVYELAYVPGFDSDVMNRLLPHITVHARTSKIERDFADPIVLAAVDRFETQSMGGPIRTPVARQPAATRQPVRSSGAAERVPLNLNILTRGAGGYTSARTIVLAPRQNRSAPIRILEWRNSIADRDALLKLDEPLTDCLKRQGG